MSIHFVSSQKEAWRSPVSMVTSLIVFVGLLSTAFGQSIYLALQDNGYDNVIEVIDAARREDFFRSVEGWTFFAPSNEAFEDLDPNLFTKIRSTDWQPHGKDFLSQHTMFPDFSSDFFLSEIQAGGGSFSTVNDVGEPLVFTRTDENSTLMVNGVAVTDPDILAPENALHGLSDALSVPWKGRAFLEDSSLDSTEFRYAMEESGLLNILEDEDGPLTLFVVPNGLSKDLFLAVQAQTLLTYVSRFLYFGNIPSTRWSVNETFINFRGEEVTVSNPNAMMDLDGRRVDILTDKGLYHYYGKDSFPKPSDFDDVSYASFAEYFLKSLSSPLVHPNEMGGIIQDTNITDYLESVVNANLGEIAIFYPTTMAFETFFPNSLRYDFLNDPRLRLHAIDFVEHLLLPGYWSTSAIRDRILPADSLSIPATAGNLMNFSLNGTAILLNDGKLDSAHTDVRLNEPFPGFAHGYFGAIVPFWATVDALEVLDDDEYSTFKHLVGNDTRITGPLGSNTRSFATIFAVPSDALDPYLATKPSIDGAALIATHLFFDDLVPSDELRPGTRLMMASGVAVDVNADGTLGDGLAQVSNADTLATWAIVHEVTAVLIGTMDVPTLAPTASPVLTSAPTSPMAPVGLTEAPTSDGFALVTTLFVPLSALVTVLFF